MQQSSTPKRSGPTFERSFPPFPGSSAEIWEYPGNGEMIACAIVKNFSVEQRMAFRALRLKLGEQRFRECMIDALDILAHSKTIKKPGGWFYRYLKTEADA